MAREHMVRSRYQIREVSLQALAALWYEIMSTLPDCSDWSAGLYLEGELLRHRCGYVDPAALAQSPLAFRSHDVRHLRLRIASAELCVNIEFWCGERCKLLPMLRDALEVEIKGSSDREVLTVSDVVAQWAGRSLRTQRRSLWLNLGAFAAGAWAIKAGAELMELYEEVAVLLVLEWVLVFWVACLWLRAIPAVERWTVSLRIVHGPGAGAQRLGPESLPAPEPDPGSGTMHARTGEHPESPP